MEIRNLVLVIWGRLMKRTDGDDDGETDTETDGADTTHLLLTLALPTIPALTY